MDLATRKSEGILAAGLLESCWLRHGNAPKLPATKHQPVPRNDLDTWWYMAHLLERQKAGTTASRASHREFPKLEEEITELGATLNLSRDQALKWLRTRVPEEPATRDKHGNDRA